MKRQLLFLHKENASILVREESGWPLRFKLSQFFNSMQKEKNNKKRSENKSSVSPLSKQGIEFRKRKKNWDGVWNRRSTDIK